MSSFQNDFGRFWTIRTPTQGKIGSFLSEYSSKSRFFTEALVEKMDPVVMEKNELEKRDEAKFNAFLSFSNHQDYNARN